MTLGQCSFTGNLDYIFAWPHFLSASTTGASSATKAIHNNNNGTPNDQVHSKGARGGGGIGVSSHDWQSGPEACEHQLQYKQKHEPFQQQHGWASFHHTNSRRRRRRRTTTTTARIPIQLLHMRLDLSAADSTGDNPHGEEARPAEGPGGQGTD